MVLNLGHFGKQIRNTLKVLKRGTGNGCRRSVRTIMSVKKCYNSRGEEQYPTNDKKKEG
jgi:hypothetical protein